MGPTTATRQRQSSAHNVRVHTIAGNQHMLALDIGDDFCACLCLLVLGQFAAAALSSPNRMSLLPTGQNGYAAIIGWLIVMRPKAAVLVRHTKAIDRANDRSAAKIGLCHIECESANNKQRAHSHCHSIHSVCSMWLSVCLIDLRPFSIECIECSASKKMAQMPNCLAQNGEGFRQICALWLAIYRVALVHSTDAKVASTRRALYHRIVSIY